MASEGKRVLLLGSGLCSPPFVRYIARHGMRLTVASRTLARAEQNIEGLPNASAARFDAAADDADAVLDALVRETDVVVSLLPYVFHPVAARVALRHSKHFCTASYVSPALAELDAEAREKGVVMINECGVDPGLDIMSAQKVIDEVHAEGGKVLEFFSVCGGLPAPAANNNPFGYKLSWSPRGVLLAAGNSATVWERNEVRKAAGPQLYSDAEVRQDRVEEHGIGDLEWYYNRDSVMYRDIHGVPEAHTVIRGTYRYKGWCAMMRLFALSGAVRPEPLGGAPLEGLTVREAGLRVFKAEGEAAAASEEAARAAVAAALGVDASHDTLERLAWVGYFDGEARVPAGVESPLDLLGLLFDRRMQYAEGEKDMIVMRHTFEVERASGLRETLTSTLIDFGLDDGRSSMSRTVALPLAVTVRAICEGRLGLVGLHRPTSPEWYNLVLDEMAAEHQVAFEERTLGQLLWIRAETKPGEQRAPLSPEDCAALLKAGYRVTVERSPTRGIPDAEYEAAGCSMAEAGSWPRAPLAAIVCGLKELPEGDDSPLAHRHVFFAHAYKGQVDWKETLGRFVRGGGSLYDLEFLVDDAGRRVAAFGRPAGEVGMALGLLSWAARQRGEDLNAGGARRPWASYDAMIADVSAEVRRGREAAGGAAPDVLVVGALGRSGRGAVAVAKACGLEPVEWDLAETKAGGPFDRMVEADVLVNCIYLTKKIAPFVTPEMVRRAGRRLVTFVDVSADTTNPNSPVPFYNEATTLDRPVLHLECGDAPVLDIVAIDHLPTLLPVESTRGFSTDLLPSMLGVAAADKTPVWTRAAALFAEKTAPLRE